MYDSQAVGSQVNELAEIVESIVERVLGKALNRQLNTFMTVDPRMSTRLAYLSETRNGDSQVLGQVENVGKLLQFKNTSKAFGAKLSGLAGIGGAYQNADPLGGALSGFQLGEALGGFGELGAALGFLAGALGKPKTVDRWEKPTFIKAGEAVNKWFTLDRGEEELYYMPESFYFGGGWSGPRNLVVRIGNNQFDDHIRNSLTESYASQLERGLVV